MTNPVCSACNRSGNGILFKICSPYGFGTYCVECEDKIEKEKDLCSESRSTLH